jgi:hypothetical protein
MLTKAQIDLAKATQLSNNFTLFELIKSDSYPDMVEYPSKEVEDALRNFALNILQPIRDKFGAIRINSGYRNPRVNKAVGGVSNSIHMVDISSVIIGCAADIVPLEADLKEVFDYIGTEGNIPGLKTVIIYRKKTVTRTPFIHIDNRKNAGKLSKMEKTGPGKYELVK